mmetsp:Transcript_14761/g.19302  ORF Transcript_14761/g.19302 Transcript_14761/m.19302 type:complete len:278 (-) Transcript_14761:399-1232(-)
MTDKENNHGEAKSRITTIIFDVDDSLYDRSTGFSAYRNGPCVQQFMMQELNFPTAEAALELRDEYFARTHATAKALQLAEKEGRLPPPDPTKPIKSPRFDPQELSDWWATHMKFEMLSRQDKLLKDLKDCPLKLVAFSNGPRKYVKKVLEALGLFEVFGEERLFAVDDLLPHCKPEKEAFEVVLEKIGSDYSECVMVEDSMKNVRKCKELGIRTVLITGKGRMNSQGPSESDIAADKASGVGETPLYDDPAVDLAMETAEELRALAPGLWNTPATFP